MVEKQVFFCSVSKVTAGHWSGFQWSNGMRKFKNKYRSKEKESATRPEERERHRDDQEKQNVQYSINSGMFPQKSCVTLGQALALEDVCKKIRRKDKTNKIKTKDLRHKLDSYAGGSFIHSLIRSLVRLCAQETTKSLFAKTHITAHSLFLLAGV